MLFAASWSLLTTHNEKRCLRNAPRRRARARLLCPPPHLVVSLSSHGSRPSSYGRIVSHVCTSSQLSRQPSRVHISGQSPTRMDCLKAIQGYIDKIVTNTPGIKVLLLDAETVRYPATAPERSSADTSTTDADPLARFDSIHPPLARGVPYGPYRQPVTLPPCFGFECWTFERRSVSAQQLQRN